MPTRVRFLSLGSISITLEMWIGPSRSITPPSWLPVAVWLGRVWRLTMLSPVDVDAILAGVDAQDLAGLAAILAGDHDHLVVASDPGGHHSTSGASETIFMKLRSRSSRATGPKMRVPRGLFCASMITAAFSSKAM